MDLVIINNVKKRRIPFIFMSFLKGKHLKPKPKDFAEHIVCEEAVITNKNAVKLQLDGEIYENLPFRAKLVKGKLRTFGI